MVKKEEDFKNVLEVVQYFNSEEKCRKYLEEIRWKNGIKCPHCKHEKIYKFSDNKRYKCASCLKKFTVISKSVFENTNISLRKWIVALYLATSLKKGISSVQLAKELSVTQKTSWFMLQRIREMLKEKETKKLGKVVELDETFVGGKNKNRHWDKKVKNSQGRSFKDKTPVFGMLSNGRVTTIVIPDTKGETLKPLIYERIEKGSVVVSDEWWAYNGLSGTYQHEIVRHDMRKYRSENGFDTNSIEGFWSHLKRGIIGVYHYTSSKHLQKYCNEFQFRYNTREETAQQRLNIALGGSEGRLKYKDLIKKV